MGPHIGLIVTHETRSNRDRRHIHEHRRSSDPYTRTKTELRSPKEICSHISILPWRVFTRDNIIRHVKKILRKLSSQDTKISWYAYYWYQDKPVGSHHGRSDLGSREGCDPQDSWQEDLRWTLLASKEASPIVGYIYSAFESRQLQKWRSLLAETGIIVAQDSGFKKFKSAFLCDQEPKKVKRIFFGDRLAVPARSWYSQLSRSNRLTYKFLLEKFMARYRYYRVSIDLKIIPRAEAIGLNVFRILVSTERRSNKR